MEKSYRKNERGRGWGEFNIKRTAFQLVENKLPVWTKSFKGESKILYNETRKKVELENSTKYM